MKLKRVCLQVFLFLHLPCPFAYKYKSFSSCTCPPPLGGTCTCCAPYGGNRRGTRTPMPHVGGHWGKYTNQRFVRREVRTKSSSACLDLYTNVLVSKGARRGKGLQIYLQIVDLYTNVRREVRDACCPCPCPKGMGMGNHLRCRCKYLMPLPLPEGHGLQIYDLMPLRSKGKGKCKKIFGKVFKVWRHVTLKKQLHRLM